MPTNPNKITALDYLRVLAILMVLACHWLQGHNVLMRLGTSLGAVANCTFFLLSGLTLGIAWRKHDCERYGLDFLIKRFKRIYPSFFVFVVGLAGYLGVFYGGIEFFKVVLNLFMLSWFAKLPMGGHLWFVTGLMMLYGLIFFATRHPSAKRLDELSVIVIIATCALSEMALYIVGIEQGYLLTLLLCGIIGFIFSDKILNCATKCDDSKYALVVSVAVALIMTVVAIMLNGRVALWIYYWPACIAAFGLLFFTFSVVGNARVCTPVGYIAGISYELYLVHYPFSGVMPIWLYGAVSIALAFLLNRMVKVVIK